MGRAQPKRPAKRRTSRSQQGASRGLPGWAMMTIGLIIGLFVAFLVYLDDLDNPPASSVERPADEPNGQGSDRQATGGTEEGGGESESPEFEFYSILPDLEVVVPDSGQSGKDTGETAKAEDEETSTGGSATMPKGEGTYYLQAGSFQEPEQADRMKARISLLGLEVDIQNVRINGARWHRVRVGPYTDPEKLRDAQERLRGDDIDFLVTRKKSSG